MDPVRYMIDSDILIAMLRDISGATGLRQRALDVGLQNCYASSPQSQNCHRGISDGL